MNFIYLQNALKLTEFKDYHFFKITTFDNFPTDPSNSYQFHFFNQIVELKTVCTMYTYDLLETGCYYLVKEKEESPVTLIKVAVESDHCLFIQHYDDPMETSWKLKKDQLFDIIECLSDETVREWEAHFLNGQDAFFREDDEE